MDIHYHTVEPLYPASIVLGKTFFLGEKKWPKTPIRIIDYQTCMGQCIMLAGHSMENTNKDRGLVIESGDLKIRGALEKVHINLYRRFLVIKIPRQVVEIKLTLSEKKYDELKASLQVLFRKPGELSILEKKSLRMK